MIMSFLRRLPPETAHRAGIAALRSGGGRFLGRQKPDPLLATTVAGLTLSNPIGLAAGFDKNAEVVAPMFDLGFGFVEVGTVTPRPQAGNARPRLFRLSKDGAIINRMGFNNDGAAKVAARLAALRQARPVLPGPVGVNLGCNRDSDDPVADYRIGVDTFADLADYLVINVSSPNTPGLRALQAADALRRLLAAVMDRCAARQSNAPVFVKIAPDLTDAEIEALAGPLIDSGVGGVLATNTTVERPATLASSDRTEAGGLSGRPLAPIAGRVQGRLIGALGGALPVIGVGGITSGQDAYGRITAGAAAIQLYSALVFQGPGLIRSIRADLAAAIRADGHVRVADAVGARWGAVDAA